MIAAVVVLQALEGRSDRGATEALRTDLRWKVAAGLALDDERFHPTAPMHTLRASDAPARVFDAVRTICNWRNQDQIDRGLRPGVTTKESVELTATRKASEHWRPSWPWCHLPGWEIRDGGIEMFRPETVTIERYRYRGAQIPTPWPSDTTTGSPTPAA